MTVTRSRTDQRHDVTEPNGNLCVMKTDSLPGNEEGRPVLDAARLNGALASRPVLWREVTVVEETGSTNADLLAQARSGAGEGLVLVAEAQTSGRGRMGRRWISPPRRSLTFSVLLRPAVPAGLLGWVPLLAGVAVASALEQTAGVDARLKWPNDVLVDGAKIAGILAERWGSAIVVGTGINVLQQRGELPAPTATSLLVAQGARVAVAQGARGAGPAVAQGARAAVAQGARVAMARGAGPAVAPGAGVAAAQAAGAGSAAAAQAAGAAEVGGAGPAEGPADGADMRERLLTAVLDELAHWYRAWLDQRQPGDAGACGLREEYLRRSGTVGTAVTVMLPGGQDVTGTAAGIDAAGRLEIRTPTGLVQVSAGDVVHLRGTAPRAAG
jgi:BirA family transcriptional regulator, biotin operon repressor / biotin---[acetyl-CoA-carboxylase] ligase